ncbi:unnamed protein product [Ceutorhynchus assimilis]|uniref:FHA domain-containing protein n=1 Tax=Ceutorhynchus assimilis TaxID=467358 RepID=A0A9N9MS76_9CUCU|nr:unnamed protein product [Ceutorhynchus assimilis]
MDTEIKEQENNAIEETKIQETIDASPPTEAKQEVPFKKPTLLIGKIGRLPKKVLVATSTASSVPKQELSSEEKPAEESIEILDNEVSLNVKSSEDQPAEQLDSKQALSQPLTIPYKEPNWSGLPETTGKPYAFEVLKNGKIIQTIDLMKKSFWVFGRLLNCDISAQHPTVSRYHAVVQYRDIPSETEPPGFYVYDLGSTHGTFLNGKNNKLKPKMYAPIRVGHILRLGLSQRHYILTGPEDDQEEESELSVTELKQLREQKIKEHKEKMQLAELEREEKRKKEEERGVDWGMGDDADDDEEMGENPYASTNNEELYLDDPKKALRGFFEREGLELEYNCTEQGMGQFLCKVELPVDDEMGRPIVAEVLHRGKKKEAVVQCALEACRVLDRFGVLRQATHESRKRKSKNWEENDYYDSDEDTFLDRTGTIEKKREKRMKVREPDKVETYETLLEREREISSSITRIEQKLHLAQEKQSGASLSTQPEEDSLDSYMNMLGKDKLDKQTISKLKLELADLRKSHSNVIKLVNIAKPANLPALVPLTSTSTSNINKPKRVLPLFGKRRKVPVKFPAKPNENIATQASNEDDEESDEDKEEATETLRVQGSSSHVDSPMENNGLEKFNENETNIAGSSSSNDASKDKSLAKNILGAKESSSSHVDEPIENNRLESFNETNIASSSSANESKEESLALNGDFDSLTNHHLSKKELNTQLRIHNEREQIENEDQKKSASKSHDINKNKPKEDEDNIPKKSQKKSEKSQEINSEETDEKKRKKNQKRNEQRQYKAELEKLKGYEEDASKEDYNMWVPPTDQSGDGRTDLNDKYGY